MHLGKSEGSAATLTHNRTNVRLEGNNDFNDSVTVPHKRASTERQQLLAMHLGKSEGSVATLTHNRTISLLSRQKCFPRHRHDALKMSVNGALTILGLPSWKIKGLCDHNDLQSYY